MNLLFLCTGNSARSQMAEGFARHFAPPGVQVHSAGVEPAGVNPRAAAVMREEGIDISGQWSKGLEHLALADVDMVVTLCGDAAERCPVLPREVERRFWPLRDPARAEGGDEEVTRVFREVRDEIRERVRRLCTELAQAQGRS
ncbi:MAG: arsenate reductase ArsC [Gemmatimonadetes bacterium]|nr:arsenate reductase ArsC [Gemmatimonadota bacterium]